MSLNVTRVSKNVMQIGTKVVFSVEVDCRNLAVAVEYAEKISARIGVETVKHRHDSPDTYLWIFSNPSMWEAVIDEINEE